MDENTNNVVDEEAVDTTAENEVKTYTQEEVIKLLQSETDRKVTQALKTQQKKYEKQLSLSKLDGEERAKAEKDAEKLLDEYIGEKREKRKREHAQLS